ncbi:hypothetical protein HELRODRAFT_189900 [Helobdella robusta]|uniref:Uncharacterized protein n=1 Tax=Helobdella robusta TaxID=6412 RepID=T1FRG6_HELRO|nr:hypothetical protein HELRODRAFT_189900 [Helobdella robusta]ESN90566.1 hypothetical protein HELRODRAFT_189900 [Helobdella robusta]
MLINQGMQDICMAPPGQQVAYLLIERARLMDTIEEIKQRYLLLNQSNFNANRLLSNYNGGLDSGYVSGRSESHQSYPSNNDSSNSWNISNLNELLVKVENLEINNKLLEDKLKEISPEDYEDLVQNGVYKLSLNDFYEEFDNSIDKKTSSPSNTMTFQKPKSLVEAIERLRSAEVRCHRVKHLQNELRLKKNEIETLNSQLVELRQHRSTTTTTTTTTEDGLVSRDELQQQQDLALKHGEKIETLLKSVEEHLMNIKSTSKETRTDGENEISSPMMNKQLKMVQKEFEMLKEELVKMMNKYDAQASRYREHKLACKNKIFKIKDTARREREDLLERVADLENKLILSKEHLDGELIYKQDLENSIKNLLAEQKSFINQISERDETIHVQKLELNSLQSNLVHMEQEVKSLTQKLSMSKDASKKYVFDHSTSDQGSTVIISTLPTSGDRL